MPHMVKPTAATVPPTSNDQRIAAGLEVEILADADTLVPELVVDDEVTTVERALVRIAQERRHLDEAESIVRRYDAPNDPAFQQPDTAVVTAAERGQEWMELYGCTPVCVLRHDLPRGNPGWHHSLTVKVTAPARLATQLASEEPETLLDARVSTTNDNPETWGIETRLWVGIPGDTMELSLDQTDKLIAGLEGLLPQLRALRALQAEVEKGDRPRDEAAVARFHAQVAADNARRPVRA